MAVARKQNAVTQYVLPRLLSDFNIGRSVLHTLLKTGTHILHFSHEVLSTENGKIRILHFSHEVLSTENGKTHILHFSNEVLSRSDNGAWSLLF